MTKAGIETFYLILMTFIRFKITFPSFFLLSLYNKPGSVVGDNNVNNRDRCRSDLIVVQFILKEIKNNKIKNDK